MSDSSVPVLTVTSGPNIEVSELTNDAGTVVKRQRFAQGDPEFVDNLAGVSIDGEVWVGGPHFLGLLTDILVELRVATAYLQSIANSRDEPDSMRNDPSFNPYIGN